MSELKKVLKSFSLSGRLVSTHPFKVGHINETFISTWEDNGRRVRYLHQMVNHFVFKDVPGVMRNIESAITHIKNKCGQNSKETLTIVPTIDARSFVQDEEGNFWRTYEFLEDTIGFEVCTEPRQAYEAARVMGRFLRYLSDCNPSDFIETIPKFQSVSFRFEQLDQACSNDVEGRAKEARAEIEFANSQRERATIIDTLLAERKVPTRVTHSDPKFNNILFKALPAGAYGEGVAVVDLDTIMPGTMLFDFGDLARSVIVSAREDEVDLEKVRINEDFFAELVRGYLTEVGELLQEQERKMMATAPRLIALSLGVRFLADYLTGDKYFKIHRLRHNLERARTQFRIVSEMERLEERMQAVVDASR